MLEFLRVLEKAQSGCSQSKHGLYGHVTPNFTARENQRNSTEEEAGTAFSWCFIAQWDFCWAGRTSLGQSHLNGHSELMLVALSPVLRTERFEEKNRFCTRRHIVPRSFALQELHTVSLKSLESSPSCRFNIFWCEQSITSWLVFT